jgi:hypothetical protein
MKPVYAVLCEFGGTIGESDAAEIAAGQAWALVLDWVYRDSSAEVPTTPTGRVDLGTGASASWTEISLENRSVRRLVHAIEPSATTPTGWRTIVWICRDQEHSWGVVRSGPENHAGVVTAIRFEAARPRFVGDWIEKLRVVRDRRPLSVHALNYGQSDLPKLLELLMDPRRQLPVVAISRAVEDGGAQPTLVPPSAISYDLAGNAHVVVVDRRAAWGLTESLGGACQVF